MLRVKNNTIPEAFENKFEIVHHHYLTRHSKSTSLKLKFNLRLLKLQCLHVGHISGITLQIKIEKELQPHF